MKHSFFENRGMWLKGNIHSHTTVSDGVCEPDRQIRDYRDRGYDFLAVTDHNIMDSFQQELEGICLIPGWERDITYSKTKCVHLVGLSGRPAGEQKAFSMERPDPSEVTVPAADGQYAGGRPVRGSGAPGIFQDGARGDQQFDGISGH